MAKKAPTKGKPGRPRAAKPKGQQIAFRVDDETARRLDALCERNHVERSVLLRVLVMDAIDGRWSFRGG